MKKAKIKVGHQQQADKPIYLLHNGTLVCGSFEYKGRYKKRFTQIYEHIVSLNVGKVRNGVLDVSHFQYWNAIRIYHEYVAVKWIKTVSAVRLEEFASETEVFLLLEEVREEFKRAVGLKWKKVRKNSGPSDPKWPSKGWQIL